MIFFVLAGVMFISSCNYKHLLKKNQRTKLYFILMWFIYGLRSIKVGWDNENYFKVFNNQTYIQSDFFQFYMEPGYVGLNYLCHFLTDNYIVFQFLIGAIFLSCMYFFITKKAKNPDFVLFLFVTEGIYALGMNQVRQSVAAMLILVVYVLYEEKKYLQGAVFFMFAVSIHLSAILCIFPFLVCLILNKNKLNVNLLSIGIIIFSILSCIVSQPMVMLIKKLPVVGEYCILFEQMGYIRSGHYSYAFIFIILFFSGLFLNNCYNRCDQRNNCIELWAGISVFFSVIAVYFSPAQRMFHYFQPFLMLYIANAIEKIPNVFVNRIFSQMLIEISVSVKLIQCSSKFSRIAYLCGL